MTFTFELTVNKLNNAVINRLAETMGGRPDCHCMSTGGKHYVTFDRKGRSLGAAIDSAMNDCKSAGLKVREVRFSNADQV
jgi:hypothetical protein